ncbi:MAG: hypothetical protein PHY79_24745 [Anaerolineae bacterium]|nr:hypothetical protein [Anaerolineae bacterium]MDX9831427.1 hypothetical protein [Anaerolineae bacterium]
MTKPLTPGYKAPGAGNPPAGDESPDDLALRALESLLAGEYDHADEALKGIPPARLRRLALAAQDLARMAQTAALRPYICGWGEG